MRKIEKIILHCSASNNEEHDNIDAIREWHLKRGWSDIGYHYLITTIGDLFLGRPLAFEGAHCYGHNGDSVGICLTGLDAFSIKQFETNEKLIKNLLFAFNLTINDVYGHYEFNKHKTCPNIDMDKFRKNFYS